MATTFLELRNLTRDYLNDWEHEDRLGTTINTTATSFDVLDGTRFATGDVVQIGNELIYVSSVATNTLTVIRGWRRTTKAAHTSGDTLLRTTTWTDRQLGDWINESMYVIYPWLYQRAEETATGSSTSFDYALTNPTETSQIERIEAKYGSEDSRIVISPRNVRLRDDGSTVSLYIPAYLSGYTLTITYVAPHDLMTDDTDETSLPTRAKLLPVYYAASRALEQREALRSRYDGYEVTQNERMVREGQQIATGSYYWQLFERLRHENRMPPPGRL